MLFVEVQNPAKMILFLLKDKRFQIAQGTAECIETPLDVKRDARRAFCPLE